MGLTVLLLRALVEKCSVSTSGGSAGLCFGNLGKFFKTSLLTNPLCPSDSGFWWGRAGGGHRVRSPRWCPAVLCLMPRTGASPGCTKLPITTSPITSHPSQTPGNSFPLGSLGHPTPSVPGVPSQHGCMGCGAGRAPSFHLCYCFGQCWRVLSSPLATP